MDISTSSVIISGAAPSDIKMTPHFALTSCIIDLRLALATKYRLPAMYPWHFYTEIGGLMSYAASIPGFHYRSATYVDRILKGAKPGTIPVEQPTKLDLVVNVKAASAIGWTIPPSLLLRADQVIQ